MASSEIELDLERVAELSRLALDEDEQAALHRDLNAILGQFSTLEEMDADRAEETHEVSGQVNALREDRESEPFDHVDDIRDQAPRIEDGLVKVPKSL